MGPDSSRLTAQDSSARDGWPCGDWPERQRATRVHHTATFRRRGAQSPNSRHAPAYGKDLRCHRAEGHCLHTTVPKSDSATSARLYFRLEGGRKQPIAARSGLASPASELRLASSGRGNSLAPQGAEAGRVTKSPSGRVSKVPRHTVSPERSPSSLWPPLGSLHNTTTSALPGRIASSTLEAHCLFQAQFACPQSYRSQLPPGLQLPSTGAGREVSLRGRHPPALQSLTFLDRVVLKRHRCRGPCGRT